MSNAVFSDSWFRIANARVSLLTSTRVERQHFGGQPWYVLQDTYSHRFFRISPQAYAFLVRLTPEKTVEETWLEFIAERPEEAPGQEDIVRVLSQLHVANMLYFDDLPDNQAIYQRSQKQRRRELQAKLMGFLYVRIYLFDPDRWLDRCTGLISALTSRLALAIWTMVVLAGLVTTVQNWDALFDHSQGLFSLSNLPWLFLSITVMKLLHETGHGFVCKRYGGRVNAFGVMFLILTPLPYVDMTSSWTFKNRFHRALVGAAGMMVELFLAAIAAVIWSQTSPGLVNSLAFNVMVVGSVSSLLFNGNPLLRFDAYYILADLIDIPNLYQKAQQQWLYFGDRYLLGTKDAESPANNARERRWFVGYGLLAFLYRLLITVGIVLFVMDQWFVVGLVMVAVTLITMVVMPARKLIAHLRGPKVAANRRRALAIVWGLLIGILALGQFVPMPYSIKASGVLQAHQSSILHAVAEGRLVEVSARNGELKHADEVLAVLSNPELDYEYEAARQLSRELDAHLRQSMANAPADVAPLEQRLQALRVHMAELEKLRTQLVVRAPHTGEWVAPTLHERSGSWILRGQALGELVRGDRYRFVAVVPQEQADALFRHPHRGVQLRLAGQSEYTIEISEFTLIPYQRERLSSSALGFAGGGDIAVKPDDQSGQTTAEPFFELHALLPAQLPPEMAAELRPVHGLSGVLRIPLPSEPLFWQANKALLQLFQKRYGL